MLEIVGLRPRLEPPKVLTRLVSCDDRMKARAIRLAAGPMGGRVRRKELRTPRLADQARTTAPRVAVFGNRAAREPHFDDVNSLKPNAHSSPPLLAKRRAHSLARRAPRSDRARHRLPSSRIFRSPLTAQAAAHGPLGRCARWRAIAAFHRQRPGGPAGT